MSVLEKVMHIHSHREGAKTYSSAFCSECHKKAAELNYCIIPSLECWKRRPTPGDQCIGCGRNPLDRTEEVPA